MDDLKRTFNVFYPEIFCTQHNQPVIKGCSEFTCRRMSLMCQSCVAHEHQVFDFQTFCSNFCKQLETYAKLNRNAGKLFLRDNLALFKAIHNQAQHIEKFKDNINAQKMAIAQDITKIQEIIILETQKSKDQLYAQLDQYQQQYIETFSQFERQFRISFSLSTDYYYSNIGSFTHKLSQTGIKANDLIGYIKQSTDFQKSLDELNQLTQQLNIPMGQPLYSALPDVSQVGRQISETIRQYFNQKLKTQSPPQNQSPARRQSNEPQKIFQQQAPMPNLIRQPSLPQLQKPSILITNGGGSVRFPEQAPFQIQFKPLKKYQLDFPVSCMLSLTNNLFVMTSAADNKMHVFDRESKRANLFPSHDYQTQLLEKIDLSRTDYSVFVSASMDGSMILWQTQYKDVIQLRKYQYANKPVISVIDFQNEGGFLFLDAEGRLGYCNYFTNEEVIHSVKIQAKRLTLFKQSDSFISYTPGNEGGTIWKLTEVQGRKEFKANLAYTIPAAPLILSTYPNHFTLISSTQLVVNDIESRTYERLPKQGGDVDSLVFEFVDQQSYLVVPVAYGSIILYKVERRSGIITVREQEVKLESFNNLEVSGRPKMRLFKEADRVFLIVSKTSELLIYEVTKKAI